MNEHVPTHLVVLKLNLLPNQLQIKDSKFTVENPWALPRSFIPNSPEVTFNSDLLFIIPRYIFILLQHIS